MNLSCNQRAVTVVFLLLYCSADGFDVFPITTDLNDQHSPAVYGDIVVWADSRNGNWDIYGYDLSENYEFQITFDPADQGDPAIHRNIVVWTDERNGNADIYGLILPVTVDVVSVPLTPLPELPQYSPGLVAAFITVVAAVFGVLTWRSKPRRKTQ